jgi:hypothetical protein
MAKIERHEYKKINKKWRIYRTTTLHFTKIPYDKKTISKYIEKIKEFLTPELLNKKYIEQNRKNKFYGHCYHATQAMYFLLNTKSLEKYSGIDYRGEHHWWLQDIKDGSIIDVTAEQYFKVNKQPPYDKGKIKSWYGWKQRPHMRSLKLILKLQPKSRLNRVNVT